MEFQILQCQVFPQAVSRGSSWSGVRIGQNEFLIRCAVLKYFLGLFFEWKNRVKIIT